MGDAVNIFLFPDLTPASGSKAALLAHRWDVIIGGGELTPFSETILLMERQNVVPITGWEAAAKQLEAWGVICAIFLGDTYVHPDTYEVLSLPKEATGVVARLWAQARSQTTSPTALLSLIQTEFNESFCQALERQQRVRWPEFNQPWQVLATRNFRPDNAALPGSFAPLPPQPASVR